MPPSSASIPVYDMREHVLALTRPEQLFPGDLDAATARHRELMLVWHPDKPGGHAGVAAKINELFGLLKAKLAAGTWEGPTSIELARADGKPPIVIKSRRLVTTTWGRLILADHYVVSIADAAHNGLVHHWWSKKFLFASAGMKEKCGHFVPDGYSIVPLVNGEMAVIIKKPADMLRLRDVRDHDRLDARHVAWMISELCSLACYLEFSGIVHHDLSLDTLFVDPEKHTLLLAGGWWHAHVVKSGISSVPKRTHDVMPFAARRDKRASILTVLELVRLTGRELLAHADPAPPAMTAWMTATASGSAIDCYKSWSRALTDSFGARKFVELSLTADAVYGR